MSTLVEVATDEGTCCRRHPGTIGEHVGEIDLPAFAAPTIAKRKCVLEGSRNVRRDRGGRYGALVVFVSGSRDVAVLTMKFISYSG